MYQKINGSIVFKGTMNKLREVFPLAVMHTPRFKFMSHIV